MVGQGDVDERDRERGEVLVANPYPAQILRDDGSVDRDGFVDFTDPDNQPGGSGLPTGWTQDDDDPSDVDSNGGYLNLGGGHFQTVDDASLSGAVVPGEVAAADGGGSGEQYRMSVGEGIYSVPLADVPAFSAHATAGGTIALDGGGLPIQNIADGVNPTDAATVSQVAGGSQTVKAVRVPITFDTAGILTGVPIYTPAVGDVIYLSNNGGVFPGGFLSVVTAFTSTAGTAQLYMISQGDTAHAIGASALDGQPANAAFNAHLDEIAQAEFGNGPAPLIAQDTTPIVVYADDGSGGDPGLLTGAGEVCLVVIAA